MSRLFNFYVVETRLMVEELATFRDTEKNIVALAGQLTDNYFAFGIEKGKYVVWELYNATEERLLGTFEFDSFEDAQDYAEVLEEELAVHFIIKREKHLEEDLI